MKDIMQCASLLNISTQDIEEIINRQSKNFTAIQDDQFSSQNYVGKSVCFTGTLSTVVDGHPITREQAHIIALEHGLIIKNGVTKGLDYLVTADPYTMSSKAKKARQYNVEILAEQAFWNMLKVNFA
jgi:DNA polymerase-3 subunit epsilon